MVHAFQLQFIDCDYPRALVWFIGCHAVMFFFLFKEFYEKSYKEKDARKALKVPHSNGYVRKSSNAEHDHLKENNFKQNKASDYYVNGGHYSSDISHRIKSQWSLYLLATFSPKWTNRKVST